VKYSVFCDLRKRGYVVKTALKFGAEFRVYDKGKSVGEDHARWILFPVSENNVMTWHDFSAKNRVAHSTNKALLIAIVDEEGDVSYYEEKWVRP
jgi:tRNA-intron endonuclease